MPHCIACEFPSRSFFQPAASPTLFSVALADCVFPYFHALTPAEIFFLIERKKWIMEAMKQLRVPFEGNQTLSHFFVYSAISNMSLALEGQNSKIK